MVLQTSVKIDLCFLSFFFFFATFNKPHTVVWRSLGSGGNYLSNSKPGGDHVWTEPCFVFCFFSTGGGEWGKHQPRQLNAGFFDKIKT